MSTLSPIRNITVRCIVPEMQEVEHVTTDLPAGARDVMLDQLLQDYNETPTPHNGRLEALGAQRVAAIYLDEIQITGETDVPISAQAEVAIGDTARIELGPTDEPSVIG